MKELFTITVVGGLLCGLAILGCEKQEAAPVEAASADTAPAKEASNIPPLDPNNIVSIAIASKDHTTLVAAIKAADYVTSVAASGPLTVFAPTNEAFAKLPDGTVENLVKPENVATLRNILQYHVTTSALQLDWLKDGQMLAMANGKKTTIGVKDGKVTINGANIIATIPAENGIVYVIDTVLIPPEG
ncbi:MAG: fasciclin domain-containing protein [Polyangiales bacterium]